MFGIFHDTFSELLNRKTLVFYIVVTALTILIVLGSGAIGVGGDAQIDIEINKQDVNDAFGNPVMRGFGSYVYFLIFLTVMAIAGLIPNMLVKGRADYYLSKPYSRTSFFLNKLVFSGKFN